MRYSFRLSLLAAACAISFSALATDYGHNPKPPHGGGSGGTPATASAVVVGTQVLNARQDQQQSTRVNSNNRNTNNVNPTQTVQVVNNLSPQASAGAAATTGSADTGRNSGDAPASSAPAASIVFEASAAPVSVGTQTAPIVDCRRTIGGGASSPGGSGVVSGIPLWEEDTCLKAMAVDLMNKSPVGTFNRDDYQEVACTNQFVAKTKTCTARAESKRVEGILERNEEVAILKLLP